MATIQKSIFYKECVISQISSSKSPTIISLQEKLSDALKALPKANERIDDSNRADGKIKTFINNKRTKDGFLCASLITFNIGNIPLTLKEDEDAEEFDMVKLLESSEEIDKTKFLQGLVYFIVKNNHLVVMSHKESHSQLEWYLNWLLKDKANVLSDDYSIRLQHKQKKDMLTKKNKPRKFSVNRPLSQRLKSKTKGEKDSVSANVEPSKIKDIIDFFRMMLPDKYHSLIDKPKFQKALENDEVRARFELSFSSINAAEPNDLILGLTEMLVADTNPNESLSKMEVEFQGGSRYNGTELILNKHVTVQEDEGLPLAYSSYENMIKYFDYLVENSEIDL